MSDLVLMNLRGSLNVFRPFEQSYADPCASPFCNRDGSMFVFSDDDRILGIWLSASELSDPFFYYELVLPYGLNDHEGIVFSDSGEFVKRVILDDAGVIVDVDEGVADDVN